VLRHFLRARARTGFDYHGYRRLRNRSRMTRTRYVLFIVLFVAQCGSLTNPLSRRRLTVALSASCYSLRDLLLPNDGGMEEWILTRSSFTIFRGTREFLSKRIASERSRRSCRSHVSAVTSTCSRMLQSEHCHDRHGGLASDF